MGRYIANGILTEISIKRRKDYWNIGKDLSDIKDDVVSSLSEILDLDMYDIEMTNSYINLSLKKELFNDNIHDLVKKTNKITLCNSLLYELYGDDYNKIDLDKTEFSKENIIIELRTMRKDHYHIEKGETYLYCKKEIELDYPFMPYYLWCLTKNEINSDLEVQTSFVKLYSQYDKYEGEDECPMLYLLNHFSRNYIKDNPLYKSLFFYITG